MFDRDQVAAYPPLALTAALCATPVSSDQVEHWMMLAANGRWDGPLPNGCASLESGVTMLRAIVSAQGMAAMSRDARRVAAAESRDSPWRAIAALLTGTADALQGNLAEGRAALEEAVQRAGRHLPSACVIPLSVLALLASIEDDWASTTELTDAAAQAATDAGLADYGTTALCVALEGLTAARAGGGDAAGGTLARARRLLARVDAIAPWYRASVRLVLARAYVALGDVVTAREMLHDVGPSLARTPDAVLLIRHAVRVSGMCDALTPSSGSMLSKAELRVLHFLPTHLAFPEIAEELSVSKFTIKSHAISIYRKLGVSSRRAAVERARELGLIPS